jgi:S-(hydroxymethyl)mycothiol dehydrogenase
VIVRAAGDRANVERLVIDPPGPGEVLVRILAAGVCHTDLHARLGNFGDAFPYLLGHEATAVVEALGPGVDAPARGSNVVLTWRAPCGRCRFCTTGRPEWCAQPVKAEPRLRTEDGQTLGRVLGLGSLATHIVVAASQAIPVSADLAPEATALLGCAVGTGVGAVVNVARVARGSTVAVFGCGAIGMSVVLGARLAGAAKIVAVDRVARKLDWAQEFGATDVVDASSTDAAVRVREITKTGVDYAFECVGLPQTVQQAMAACDNGGTCVVIGVPAPNAEMPFSLARFFYTRGHLRATGFGDCLPSRDIPRFADLFRRGDLPIDRLVTARIGLEDVDSAFSAMERGEVLRSVVMLPH